jgi:hypothetical protein
LTHEFLEEPEDFDIVKENRKNNPDDDIEEEQKGSGP